MEVSNIMTTFTIILLVLVLVFNFLLFRKLNILTSRTNRLKRRYDALFKAQNLDIEDLLVGNAKLIDEHSEILEDLVKKLDTDNKSISSRLDKIEDTSILALEKISKDSLEYRKNIDNKIDSSIENINQLAKNEIEKLDDRTGKILEENMERTALCIQKLAFVKYNAFDYLTNELSYSLALLNDFNDGIIITSIFGREQSSIYIKEVKKGKSTSKLSEHELQALKRAINKETNLLDNEN